MKIKLEPGKYVVAVSGGVDSMVLLDILRQKPGLELIVAHFDHGIRPDSAADRKLVHATVQNLGLAFVTAEGRLGGSASEAVAREARYKFLRQVEDDNQAQAIITAHHQDDVLETAIINLLRGTGRKGLSSLQSTDDIKRPLLGVSKAKIRSYATQHSVQWHEDSTNQDETYLRNYVRHRIVPRMSPDNKQRLLQIITRSTDTNQQLDAELAGLLPAEPGSLKRSDINQLSHAATRELLAAWLRANSIRDFDRSTLERLAVAAKIATPGQRIDIIKGARLEVGKTNLALVRRER